MLAEKQILPATREVYFNLFEGFRVCCSPYSQLTENVDVYIFVSTPKVEHLACVQKAGGSVPAG